jgi:DNA/RNA non-specific endonuclease
MLRQLVRLAPARTSAPRSLPDAHAAQRVQTQSPGVTPLPHRLAEIGGDAPVQRYDMTYGALSNDCGTDMHVRIDGKNDPDLGKGGKPSVTPNWWPTGAGAVATYFSQYMVQGHLLNDNLGGPGNTMKNLTPITRSTNTTHLHAVEKAVKDEVAKDNIVEYRVRPNYGTHPPFADLGNNPPPGVAPYLNYMAGEVGADYTVYDPKKLTVTGGLPGEKFIKNEGPQNKGSYI